MADPRMYDDSNPAIKQLCEVCLAFPEVFEKESWGECTFRVTGGDAMPRLPLPLSRRHGWGISARRGVRLQNDRSDGRQGMG